MRIAQSALLALTLATSVAAAQQNPTRPAGGGGRRGGPPPAGAPQRGQMDVRRAIERLVRRELQPTEAQWRQMQAVDQRLEKQRYQLNQDEIATRDELRRLMVDTTNINQSKIAEVADRLVKFPRQRAELLETEQKELAGFLTPLQRAKYLAIQEQVRRQIDNRGRGGRPPGPPPDTSAAKKATRRP